jgi:hypothetical protein
MTEKPAGKAGFFVVDATESVEQPGSSSGS